MLTKLKIKNFKSFKDFEIELDKFNCIIAANNAGKSNLIESLKFLKYAVKDINRAIEEFGGFDNIKNIFLETKFIEFVLEFNKENFDITFIEKEDKKTNFLFENLNKEVILKVFERKWLKKYRINGEVQITSQEKTEKVCVEEEFIFDDKNEERIKIDNTQRSVLKATLFSLTEYFYTYSFYPEIIKTSLKGGQTLMFDGINLVEVLDFIKNNFPQKFEMISDSLIGIVEELNEIKIDKDLIGRNALLLKEKNKFLPFNIVSDGTINLLAILTSIYEPTLKKMISFDEIEKHLHLKAIDYVLEILKDQDYQVTFTTQSAEIMNNLDLKKDNLIFLYRDDEGFTKSISAKKIPNFEKKVKRYQDVSTIIKNEVLGYLGDFDEN